MSFFLHLPVSPSLLLPVPVCPCLSICLPTSPLSVCLSAGLSLLCQPDSPFLTHLSIRLYVFPFQSVYVTLSPSLCLSPSSASDSQFICLSPSLSVSHLSVGLSHSVSLCFLSPCAPWCVSLSSSHPWSLQSPGETQVEKVTGPWMAGCVPSAH